MKFLARKIFNRIARNPPVVKKDLSIPEEFHGSDYGGWTIASNKLNEKSVVYSFGIGEDTTFDLSIINKFNCTVYGFDPTPKVVSSLESSRIPDKFQFHPLAISDRDGFETFYPPENPEHISHSNIPTSDNDVGIKVRCAQLSTICKNLGHEKIDLLKMDVEGLNIAY